MEHKLEKNHLTRAHALKIVREWTNNQNLVGHMLALEAVMRFYAKKFGENEEKWGITGLLHDADWEKYPDEHPQKIAQHLQGLKADPEIIYAITSHGGKGATKPKSNLDKTLLACDELCGFVVACARVRPDKLVGMQASSVKKKMKDKGFAANVGREDIINGAKLLSVDLDDHINNIIVALQPISDSLGL